MIRLTPETCGFVLFLFGVWLRLVLEWVAWATGFAAAALPGIEWLGTLLAAILLRRFVRLTISSSRELGTAALCFLPVAVLALLRAPFPDAGYDTLHYHAYLQVADCLRIAGDYFGGGGGTYLFPLGDRVFGLWQNWLGYRAGTWFNLFCLWCVYRELTGLFAEVGTNRPSWRAPMFAVLCLGSEYVLMCLGTYSVDILSLPLLVVLWRRFAREPGEPTSVGGWVVLGIFSGLAVALKLTQIIFAAVTVFAILLRSPRGTRVRGLVVASIAGALMVFPFLHFNWIEAGNPVYPLANSVFKSPLFPPVTGGDVRWGPMTWWERFVFPFVMTFTPSRASELGFYSGRQVLLFVLPLLGLGLGAGYWVVATAAFLWVQVSGYIRYGLWIEILVVVLALGAWQRPQPAWRRWTLGLLVVIQVFAACDLLWNRSDWNLRVLRVSVGSWGQQMRRLFRDRPDQGMDEVRAARHFVNASTLGSFVVVANRHATLHFTGPWWLRSTPGAREKMLRSLEPLRGRADVMTAFYENERSEAKSMLLRDGFTMVGEGKPCFARETEKPFDLLCAPLVSQPAH